VVEHAFRPLFGFFGALALPTAVYASDADFTDGALTEPGVRARVADAAGQLAGQLIHASAARQTARAVAGAAR